ncbi:1-phosphatidylinositol 4,5-bisphosphate phosphodiesterase delta-4-like [Sinocyclocheilus grahami]|uniref:1-phosphatidylinositol 4,5-bisphosphate phosphodiesterase delta-4-like n=1 Tax=Sinocyclocheilus grahami TaxID=75366 RepID=UPI0007ACAD59|nr:PREDICTED: 1-phosphatidylinositol 4,5-bisphosphate phosphodiesterase delta-4-like [Sinocyclocheilus grahami]
MESPQTCCEQGHQNLEAMKAGMFLRKVRSRSWKRPRHYKLQEDCKTIAYKSSWAINSYSTFSISDVEVVREGHQSEALLSVADEFPAVCCFTLVFRGRRGNLDLVADSAKEAQAWIQGIRALMENMENMDESTKLDHWISDWFLKADLNKDGRINFKEAKKLLKMMNVDMNEEHACCLFMMADKSESGTLEDQEFVEFYKMLTERTEVLDLFQGYSSDGQSLSQCDLEEFLREEQLEGEGSYEHALQLIDRYEPSDTDRCRQQLPKVKQKEWSIVDPLVRVEIYGVPLDRAKQETKYIDNNGFNPHWNESLQFTIHTPELALVRFVVEDYDKASRNDFIGQYTIPFTNIQPGYRHVHLLSKDGTSIHPSSIYVHIKITEL